VESAPTTTSCWFRTRSVAVAAALALVLIRVAVAQQLPAVGGVPVPLPGTPIEAPSAPATIAWTTDIPAAPTVSPVITADRVIVAHLPGIVSAFDRTDGRPLWRVDLQAQQPLATDGTLVFVPAGEAIHALHTSDGSLAWRVSSGRLTAPLVVKEGWIVGPVEGKLIAWRSSDGHAVWTVDAPLQREAAAIAGDVLYVPVVGGHLVARDLPDGRIKWDRPLGGNPVEPLVVNDDVFVGASDKRFYCVDAGSGAIESVRWVGAVVRGRATTDGDRVIFVALDNLVRAIDRGDGALRWQKGVPFRPLSGPVVAAGAVFVAGSGADMRILRASDGTAAGSMAFPGRHAVAPGVLETGDRVVFAVVTGGLEESWKLSLTVPLPASLRPSR
jgi:outer membrane protein assembly factor BamB